MQRLLRSTVLLALAVAAMAANYAHTGAVAVTGNIGANLNMTETQTLDAGTATFSPAITARLTFTNGSGNNQANVTWTDDRTLAASAADTLDLSASNKLTTAFGTPVTASTVKGMIVTAASGNTNNVLVGGADDDAFLANFADVSDIAVVKPGGFTAWGVPGTGVAVVDGTSDLLIVANSGAGTPVTYRIGLIIVD